MTDLQLSVVVPVFNERDNVAPLIAEIVGVLRGVRVFEIVYVDDNSKDDTLSVLRGLKLSTPELRVFHHAVRAGQSTGIRNGVKAARAPWVVTLMVTARMIRPISSNCWLHVKQRNHR